MEEKGMEEKEGAEHRPLLGYILKIWKNGAVTSEREFAPEEHRKALRIRRNIRRIQPTRSGRAVTLTSVYGSKEGEET